LEARKIIRPVFALLCLAATALGLLNTYGDNTEVKALAEQTACGAPHCSINQLRESRSALTQSFSFQVALVQKGKSSQGASVDVECKRAQFLFGAYSCAVTSGGLPAAK